MDIYTESIVPTICTQADGDDDNDDGQYANSAMRDIECLEALSRRIHYGKRHKTCRVFFLFQVGFPPPP